MPSPACRHLVLTGAPIYYTLQMLHKKLGQPTCFYILLKTQNKTTHFTPERKILDWVSEQEIELRNLRVFTEDSFFFFFLKRDLFLLYVCVFLCGGSGNMHMDLWWPEEGVECLGVEITCC